MNATGSERSFPIRAGSTSAGLLSRGAIFALCVLCTASATLARPIYPHPVSPAYETHFVLTTDLDDDGVLDLLVFEQGLAVHLGEGDGTFSARVIHRIPSGSNSTRLIQGALGDFNADGHLDVVAMPGSASSPNPFVVYFGNGDGTFDLPATQIADVGTGYVTVANLDEDSSPDLVVSTSSGGVRRFMGHPDGAFDTAVIIPGLPGGRRVAAADLNGDGSIDLAAPFNNSDAVVVVLGNGDGSMGASTQYATGATPSWVSATDLDGDDIPDLAVSNYDSNDLSVLRGVGDGTFAPQVLHGTGERPQFVTAADLDGDGIQDLAVSNLLSILYGSVSVLLGTGNGQFAAQTGYNWTTWGITSLAVGDFDRDGAVDLANASLGPDMVGILFGRGDGTFLDAEEIRVGSHPTSADVGDLDGDGRLDLAVISERGDQVAVLLATGAGAFAPRVEYPAGIEPASIVITELTGDTALDLAIANDGPPGNVTLHEGLGDGTFAAPSSLPVGVFISTPSAIAAADLDGDEHQDLVVADESSGKLSVFLGAGDGTFAPQSYVTVGSMPKFIAVGHLDGDPTPDLAVVNAGSDDISILFGVGDGSFVAGSSLVGLADLLGLFVGDLDGDTNQDLVTISQSSRRIFAYLGDGDGTFQAPVIGLLEETPWGFTLAEIDGDGRLDLAMRRDIDVLQVLHGQGDGSFVSGGSFATRSGSEPVVTGDLNLDSRSDLVVISESYHSVTVLLNQSGPSVFSIEPDRVTLVWPAVTGATSYDVYRGDLTELVDMDDDGLPDNGYGDCITALDDDPRDTSFVDPALPAADGEGFFYLLGVIDGEGDHGLGATSAGLPRQPAAACP